MTEPDMRIVSLWVALVWRCGQSDVTIATDIIDALGSLAASAASVGDTATAAWFGHVADIVVKGAPSDLREEMRKDMDRRGIPY